MITIEKYFMGRDSKYSDECTDEIRANAEETVRRTNKLLALASLDDIIRDTVASGWRPAAINEATTNAAHISKHLTARAVDIVDGNRVFAQWCLLNLDKLGSLDLYMEDPRWCPTWVHLQCVPPLSGKRVYIPSTKPPLAPPLDGQNSIPTRLIT